MTTGAPLADSKTLGSLGSPLAATCAVLKPIRAVKGSEV